MLTLLLGILTPPVLACSPDADAEDGIDGLDDDCDGMTHVRRELVASFDSASMVSQDFAMTPGRVTIASGHAVFDPAGVTAELSLKNDFTWVAGEVHVVLAVPTLGSSGGCNARVVAGGVTYTRSLTTGVQELIATPSPGDTVTEVSMRCTGYGTSRLDWLTIQNGAYDWAPLNDLEVVFAQTKFPGGGRMTMIRSSEDGSVLFTGSDVSGFAWSADSAGVQYGIDWVTANGAGNQWEDAGATSVWDAYSDDGTEVFVVTGLDTDEQDTTTLADDDDGLYVSLDLGVTWERPAQPSSDAAMLLGATKTYDDCNVVASIGSEDTAEPDLVAPGNPTGGKPLGSGNLLVAHDGILYIASLETTTADGRGVWVRDADGDLCQPYEASSLPNGLSAPGGGTYDGLPSALRVVHPDGDASLLVGYRVLAGDESQVAAGLYLCPVLDPTFTCGSASPACEPVDDLDIDADEVLDVRDIVPAPFDDDLFLIADGGRRPVGDENFPTACTDGESTVYALRISTTGTFELWDTDGTGADPYWTGVDGSSVPYPYYGATCSKAMPAYGTVGDLLPPDTAREGELVAALLDPDGEFAFAFYPAGVANADFGCVRHFRAELPSPFEEGDTLDWRPFQAWSATEDEAEMARDRRDSASGGGSWLEGQAPLSAWTATAVQDAAFIPYILSGSDDLFVAGYNLWTVPHSSLGFGWNSDDADLGLVPWVLAWQGSWEFSGGGARGLATCVDCGLTGDDEPYDLIFGAMNDAGQKVYSEEPVTEPRPAGTRDCHLATIGGGSMDVSTLPFTQEVWQVIHNQGSVPDDDGKRMVLYSDDAGGTWFWDAAHIGGNRANFISVAPDQDTLRCQDIYEEIGDPLKDYFWYGATPVGDSFSMGDADVGQPTSILAIGEGLALLTASEACQNSNPLTTPDPNCDDGYGGEGLWFVRYDAADGMSYTKIENFVSVPSLDPTEREECDERHYFGFDTSTEVRLLSDTSLWYTAGGILAGHIDVVITSRGDKLDSNLLEPDRCGLRRVSWDIGAESSATWDVISYWVSDPDHSGNGCELRPWYTNGLELDADGASVLLFGGSRGGAGRGAGGICEVVIDLSSGATDAHTVIPKTDLSFSVEDLLAHPHVADVYFAVATQSMGCYHSTADLDCDPPGLYVIQKRNRPGLASTWGSKRVSGDDLENREGVGLAWGTGADPSGVVTDIYFGGLGGTWDGIIAW